MFPISMGPTILIMSILKRSLSPAGLSVFSVLFSFSFLYFSSLQNFLFQFSKLKFSSTCLFSMSHLMATLSPSNVLPL